MRLPSQRAHTTRSICKTRCGSEIETRSPSCRATRRSTLATLAALLVQPSLTAVAGLVREQEEQASTLEDRASDSAAATIPSFSQGSISQPTPLPRIPETVPMSPGFQVLQYTVGPAVVGAITFWIKDRELCKTQATLTHEQELTASLEQRIDSAQNHQQCISSELSATQSDVEKLQQSLQSSQQQCTNLEQARSALESEADRLNTQLVSVQSQLSESKQQLAEAQQSMATLTAQLQLTDQDKAESEKQLVDARTGIANLRSRLDDIETELRKSKVQSSLQVASLSLDLRARQQQVDAMRGELQSAGIRLAAERQQTEQQSSMLMEQLAIAQSTSADTKAALEEAVADGDAAKGLLQMERDSTALLAKARQAAVEDTKKVLAELRDANFAAEEQQESLTALEAALAAATQQLSTAQQSKARLETEVLLQSQQQQHLLDELSQSQEESGGLEKQLAAERGRSRLMQQDLAASLQESKEALHREVDIMAQLEAQDQRVLKVSAQLQQSQADLMGSQRHTAQLSDQLSAFKTKLQSSEKIKSQLTEIVQNQEQEAAEMAEQIQELEGDRQQLQVANEDLDLAEDRIGHLQDALQELQESIKVSLLDAETQRQRYEAEAEATAQADKALYQAEIAEQAASIQRLEAAMAHNLEELEATQAQLEATQSSLIDLEDHLTTLEEEDDDDLEPPSSPSSVLSDSNPNLAATGPPPESRLMGQVAATRAGQPGSDLTGASSAAASGRDNEVQSAFVSTMNSLFPPAQDISDEDAAAAEQLLCEDPYELFERSKAALQARAEQQSVGQQQQLLAKPDLLSAHQESPTNNSSLAKAPEQNLAASSVDMAVAAAQRAAALRAAESRAQAAMMVEAVEDRAYEAVLEAQAETAKHAAEADRLRQQLQYAKRDNLQD
ncbi:hypothetical protein WJX77_002082 [Trebouxia sp. C0004]